MRVKRFKAADMRQAIKMVRDEHGADAVILSNRKVKDGIEIISAIDYDESAIEKMLAKSETRIKIAPPKKIEDLVEEISDFDPEAPSSTYDESPVKLTDDTYTPAPINNGGRASSTTFQKTSLAPNGSSSVAVEKGEALLVKNAKQARDLEVMSMQRELDTLRGMLTTQFNKPSTMGIPHVHPAHTGIYTRLQEIGIRSELAHEILTQLPLSSEVNEGWRKALALLAHKLKVCDDDIVETGGVVALVGATGVGKTTTLAKLAARFALKHGREGVAIVSTDNYRIAAQDQIMSYGKMIGVPVYSCSTPESIKTVLSDLYDKQLIVIDTAGMGQRDKRVTEQLELLSQVPYPLSTYLVLSANTQENALNQIAKTYSGAKLSGCILTKIDETASLGGLLSILVKWNLSLAYVCEGQRVPDDLQRARPYSLVSKAVTLMQQSELFSSASANPLNSLEGLYNAHAS